MFVLSLAMHHPEIYIVAYPHRLQTNEDILDSLWAIFMNDFHARDTWETLYSPGDTPIPSPVQHSRDNYSISRRAPGDSLGVYFGVYPILAVCPGSLRAFEMKENRSCQKATHHINATHTTDNITSKNAPYLCQIHFADCSSASRNLSMVSSFIVASSSGSIEKKANCSPHSRLPNHLHIIHHDAKPFSNRRYVRHPLTGTPTKSYSRNTNAYSSTPAIIPVSSKHPRRETKKPPKALTSSAIPASPPHHTAQDPRIRSFRVFGTV